jgi:hypothetical protein
MRDPDSHLSTAHLPKSSWRLSGFDTIRVIPACATAVGSSVVASPDIRTIGVSGSQIFVETATHTRRGVICPALMAGLSLCNVDWTTDHMASADYALLPTISGENSERPRSASG